VIHSRFFAAEIAARNNSVHVATSSAGPRVIEITANDQMKYSVATIEAKAGEELKVSLTNRGTLPKEAMGHNWVLTHNNDKAGVIADGMKAGAANSYEKPNDARIIAHTKLIGGGESDTATFDVAKLKKGETYAYICTFPGHAALMHGTLTIGS